MAEHIVNFNMDAPRPGRWFPATYDSTCSTCEGEIEAGMAIRADGEGGWQGECCDSGGTIPQRKVPKQSREVCSKCNTVKARNGICLCL